MLRAKAFVATPSPTAARRSSGSVGRCVSRAGLAGDAGSAVPYRAARTSARHTRDAGRCPRPPDPGFRCVKRHRNDCLLRHMHRERDRAKHCAANKRCPDDSQLFHEILRSLQDAVTEFCFGSPRSFWFDKRDQFSASAVQRTRFVGSRFASSRHSAARAPSSS